MRRQVIYSSTLGLLLLLVGSVPGVGQEFGRPLLPDDPLQGRVLFEGRKCNQCHGIAGSRTGIGPSLGEGRFRGTFLELGAALWNHVPGMTVTFEVTGLPWPELTDREATELIVFLYFVDYLGRPGVAETGRAVFEEGGCDRCHLLGGGQSDRGPDLAELQRFASPLYVAQMIWNHGPTMFESMRDLNMVPPSFNEGDLADLSAFIRQTSGPGPQERLLLAPGNPNAGRDLFVAKGCSVCHGTEARGGGGGPDLTDVDLHRSAEAIAGTMWNHALAMNETMRARGLGWPEFEDSELADLVAFLYFLPFADPAGNPERGTDLFQLSSAECHAEKVAGLGDKVAASSDALVAAMWNHAPVMKRAILGEGRPWPELTGADLRDLYAYFRSTAGDD